MRRLLIFSVFALVGTGFWLFNHEERKATPKTNNTSSFSMKPEVDQNQIPLHLSEEDYSLEVFLDDNSPLFSEDFQWPKLKLDSFTFPVVDEKQEFQAWAREPEFREVKNIVPPIKGVNPPSLATLVTPDIIEQGGIINVGFEAFLHLPANALVDEDGNRVTEAVKISYCPLSDPIDVFLSGVPMNYDSAGSSETFRTAGMVRLEATTYSGKQVQLKSGLEMKLDMPTVDSSDDYNFYAFNEKKGAWDFVNPAPPARPLIEIALDTAPVKYDFDTARFADKFPNESYHYLVRSGAKYDKIGARPVRLLYGTKEKEMRQAMYATRYNATNLIKLRPRVIVAGYDEEKRPIKEVRFKITGNGRGNRYFSELRVFQSFNFSLDDIEDLRSFYKAFGSGHRFHDVRIEYTKFDDYCTIILKEESGFRRLQARINNGARAKLTYLSKARFYRAFLRYEKALKKKEEVHDQIVKYRRFDRFIAEYRIRMAIYRGRNAMNAYFRPYRQVFIPGFATYNCDQIARMKNPMPVAMVFRDSTGKRLVHESAIICDRKVRASFSFYGGVLPSCSEKGFGFAIVHTIEGSYYLNKSAYTGEDECYLKPLPDIKSDGDLRRLLFR